MQKAVYELYHSQERDHKKIGFWLLCIIPFSMEALKSLMFNSYLLDRFFKLSGIKPNSRIKDKLVKELIDIAAYQAA